MQPFIKSCAAFIFAGILCFTLIGTTAYGAESSDSRWPAAPQISADTAVLIDAASGAVLYEKDAGRLVYPADLTLLLTAYVTLTTGLPETDSSFIDQMNEAAVQAGAAQSHFSNTTGEHSADHYTSARDLAAIMRAALTVPDFISRFRSDEALTSWASVTDVITGSGDPAGVSLAAYVSDGDRALICILLHSAEMDLSTDAAALFSYGYEDFISVNADESETRTFSREGMIYTILGENTVTLPRAVSIEDVDAAFDADGEPVMQYYYGGHFLGSCRVQAGEKPSAAEAGEALPDLYAQPEETQSYSFTHILWLIMKIVLLLACIIAAIFAVLLLRAFILRRRHILARKQRIRKQYPDVHIYS